MTTPEIAERDQPGKMHLNTSPNTQSPAWRLSGQRKFKDSFSRKHLPSLPLIAIAVLAFGVCHPACAELTPGEIDFAEMNCVACHQASPAIEARLASKKSPVLGRNGLRLAPAWLHDFLVRPQVEAPGTSMPDLLHGLSAAEKAEAAEALTHYLVSLQEQSPHEATRFDAALVTAGGELFHKVGCVACHAPQELPADATYAAHAAEFSELATNSVPLGKLAKKFTVEELAAFLRDPLKIRPSGRMPAQRLTDGEARALAMYLLRGQPALTPSVPMPGLNFEYFEGLGEGFPDFNKLTAISSGYVTNFFLGDLARKNSSGLRFRSRLSVPTAGEYTFWTESADGSQLFIDGQMVVDNGGIHPLVERAGKIKLTAGEHRLMVNYLHHAGKRELKVSWAGPGLTRQQIPGDRLSLADPGKFMHLTDERPFVLDVVKAAKGQQLYESYNCAACHELNQPGRKAAQLDKLAGSQKGCLAPTPPAGAPAFAFTHKQRQQLEMLLTKLSSLEKPLSPDDQVQRSMTVLNCYACHSREGQGSPAGLRRAYFKSVGSVDLGEEGALPPHLNGVGAKLKPQWMEKVIINGASVRPYMATRMPQFGEANVRSLISAFLQADAAQKSGPDLVVDSSFANGVRLIGNDGLSCISCHMFAGHPSLGVPAIDLTTAPERLNSDWFRRYLLDPAKLRPGTRMPPFWPNGVAVNKTIHNGDTEKQISAIWSYLSSGKTAANLPPGLIRGKMELVAKSEPVIYRNFIEGAGPRAIGVGYPEKVDLAFDANQMCVALLWQGSFMDASRHWTGRGEGFQPPMGYNVVKFPAGAPFAMVSDLTAPWPKSSGQAAGYHFRGYAYDAQRHPQFRYQFGSAAIADLFLPAKFSLSPDTGFRRSLTFQSAQPMANLWFRAAVADKLEDLGNQTCLVDGSVRLTFPEPPGKTQTQIKVRSSEGKFELLVPIVFTAGTAEILEEISW